MVIKDFKQPWNGNCTELKLKERSNSDTQKWVEIGDQLRHYKDTRVIDVNWWKLNHHTEVNVAIACHDMKG